MMGIGTAPDPVEALAWHILAERQGLPDIWLATRLADLSGADRARAEKKADHITARLAGVGLDDGEGAAEPAHTPALLPPVTPAPAPNPRP